jgi:Carboxypeptidase regulatory-like domain
MKNSHKKAQNSQKGYAFYLCLLCFFVASALFAETKFSLIKGTVFTSDGQPVPGARVTIVRTDVDPKQQKKTRKERGSDSQGEFAFRMDAGPAKYHLVIEASGFRTQQKDVEIGGDERTDISVILKK